MMNWGKVITALQLSAQEIYLEISHGKYTLDEAHGQMSAATVLDKLSSALIHGLENE